MNNALVDALNELHDTDLEARKLSEAVAAIRSNPQALNGVMGWISVQGVASAVEKIYSGCERAMLIVAKALDGQSIQTTDGWHRELILRMANPFEGKRPAALRPETVAELDKLRSFRHRERNSYGSALDSVRVLEIAMETVKVPRLIMDDLNVLAKRLDSNV